MRRELAKNKCSAQWLDVMEEAHRQGMRSTATMMFGHVETLADRIEHLSRLRDLQDRTGGFTAFIGWTYQARTHRSGRRESHLRRVPAHPGRGPNVPGQHRQPAGLLGHPGPQDRRERRWPSASTTWAAP